jgi:hypothetical protein
MSVGPVHGEEARGSVRRAVELLIASAGFIVWASAFVLLYSVQAIGCHSGIAIPDIAGVSLLSVALALVWLAHLAALVGLQLRYGLPWRSGAGQQGLDRFLPYLGALVTASALVGTVWIGAPVLLLPPCA